MIGSSPRMIEILGRHALDGRHTSSPASRGSVTDVVTTPTRPKRSDLDLVASKDGTRLRLRVKPGARKSADIRQSRLGGDHEQA